MAKLSTEQWSKMTADERRDYTAAALSSAVERVKSGGFPTGIPVTIGSKKYIARPARTTDSGGITYSLAPEQGSQGKFRTRLNKFSFTLMGEGSQSVQASFDEENLLGDE